MASSFCENFLKKSRNKREKQENQEVKKKNDKNCQLCKKHFNLIWRDFSGVKIDWYW